MNSPSLAPRLFRAVVAAALATSILAATAPILGYSGVEPEIAQLTQFAGHGAALHPGVLSLCLYAAGALTAGGLLGMLFFWSPSRYLLVSGFVLGLVVTPFSGIGIYSPVEMFLGGVGSLLSVWALSVSIWSPLSARFEW